MSVYKATKEEAAVALKAALDLPAFFSDVERQYVEKGNYTYPSIFFNDIREARNRKLLDVVLIDWTVLIVVYVYDGGTTLSTTLNAAIAEALDAMKLDVTLGGKVYNVKVAQVDTDEGFLRPHGVALLTVTVTFLSEH